MFRSYDHLQVEIYTSEINMIALDGNPWKEISLLSRRLQIQAWNKLKTKSHEIYLEIIRFMPPH
jgi:hypothetical protein